MIRTLSFDGYRSFAGNAYQPDLAHHLELAPLTLVIGRNNAGKTSVLQLVRSVVQALAVPVAGLPLALDGRVLGKRFTDLVHQRDAFGQIRLDVGFDEGDRLRVAFGSPGPGDDAVWLRDLPMDAGAAPPEPPRGPTLNAHAGPALAQRAAASLAASAWIDAIRAPLSPEPSSRVPGATTPVGPRGEGTIDALYQDAALFDSVAEALRVGAGVALRWEHVLDVVRLVARRGATWVPIDQVGDGIQQVLPVLVAVARAASAPRGALLSVLQPELHLHDALHPWLGDVLLRAADDGRRILVETHAEGLLLRVRRRIAEGFPVHRVAIYYVDDAPGGSSITRVPIAPNGDVTWWPRGVFFEALEEVKAIRRAQRGAE